MMLDDDLKWFKNRIWNWVGMFLFSSVVQLRHVPVIKLQHTHAHTWSRKMFLKNHVWLMNRIRLLVEKTIWTIFERRQI